MGIYQKVLNAEESLREAFGQGFDPAAKSLITQLLPLLPALRMGMLRHGLLDIWNHPFFAGKGESFSFVSILKIMLLFEKQ
jgi:hypothetical protein